MADLSWGKPKIEITAAVNGAPVAEATWLELPTPQQDTTSLETAEGDKKEAIIEGGEVIATLKAKSKFTLKFTIFRAEQYKTNEGLVALADDDGVITKNFAVRLTPQNTDTTGFLLENCAVSVNKTYSTSEGMKLEYTFEALKPATGSILKEYMVS